jgi:hypothetical protein
MAFSKETFARNPSHPKGIVLELLIAPVVTEDEARNILKTRIEMAARRAKSPLLRLLPGEAGYSLFSMQY